MAGLIKREDIDEVRSRIRIDEIVGEHVTLKNAGVGSMKGLCPFHDERTPSFHVRPHVGMYHCFGCGESGDAFTFLQKIDHVSFSEAVERLAATAGVQLHYEEGRGPDREAVGRRQRLIEAHAVAEEFFREALGSAEAQIGRDFLTGRGFDRSAADHFGVGYAPKSWDALLGHLRGRGFNQDELAASGLLSQGNRGLYDRFRGRLTWPIRDLTGATIGFGARKLHDDDQGPKYLNTPETLLYKKNQVLYGLDLAKRDIAKAKQIVVVEGYTDVMACHLAGVSTAVATCGTAFGVEHIKVVRRMLSDDNQFSGHVVFTFDGDEAGRNAALKAFEEDQRFVAQTYVAVEKSGLDPCDLRQQSGDGAVRALIDARRPLFEFAITSTLDGIELGTVEGRLQAVRAVAPLIARIRDRALRPGYARFVAGRIGVDVDEVTAAVRAAERQRPTQTGRGNSAEPARPDRSQGGRRSGHGRSGGAFEDGPAQPPAPAALPPLPDRSDPVAQVERGALQVVLQAPGFVNAQLFDALDGKVFRTPAYRAVHDAVNAAGGVAQAVRDPAGWPERVRQSAPDVIANLVGELAVSPMPATDGEGVERYAHGIIARLFDLDMTRIAAELHSRLQRLGPGEEETGQRLLAQLQTLEAQRARLRASLN